MATGSSPVSTTKIIKKLGIRGEVMARAPNEKAKKAYQLYIRGYKLVDIGKELDIPAGTIRRWKHSYDWDAKRSLQKSERLDIKKNAKKKIVSEDVEEVIKNTELTDRQGLFCIYYIKLFNATKAYQKAYKCKYETAAVNGSRLLTNANVKDEITKLKQNKLNRAMISGDDIFQKYIDIAFSDITDFIDFGTKEIQIITKEGGVGTIDMTYTDVKNSDEVDGSLITEISNSKGGVKVKLQDKMKALQWISEHMDLATDEQKARVDKIKAEVNLLKVRKEKAEEESW